MIYVLELADIATAELVTDAANRSGMSAESFIQKLLSDAAAEEYAKQQNDDARTCND